MLLTKHEGVTFQNQTVYISGQAFVQCRFIGCTLILRETVKYLESCTFERCNWHVDWVVLWGSPESMADLKGLIGLLEQTHQLYGQSNGGGTRQVVPNEPIVTT
jgi:hypothetical protein